MKTRRGVFAVVIDESNNLLILHRVRNWRGWEVVKGGLDGNSEKKAVLEELREEAGLFKRNIVSISRSKSTLSYNYPKWYQKKWKAKGAKFHGWLARVKKKRITLTHNPHHEHDKFKWLPPAKAVKKLTFANHRKAVKEVLNQFRLIE